MPSDKESIPNALRIATTPEDYARVQKAAKKKLEDDTDEEWPHNGCAANLSALLKGAGMDIPLMLGAGALANKLGGSLNSHNWVHLPVGSQQAGDVGVTFDEGGNAGADHIYFVVTAVDSDEMVIVDNQDDRPHTRFASGKAAPGGSRKTPTEYFLRAPGMEGPIVVVGGGGGSLKHPSLAGNELLQSAARGERAFMKDRDHGTHIGIVQDALDRVLPEDERINAGVNRGTFGPRTERAVKAFQHRIPVTDDGLVGQGTLGALDKALLRLDGIEPGEGPEGEPREAGGFVRAVARTNPRRVEYFDANNCQQTKTEGTRSWRNNNPGNIVCGQFTTGHGAIGCDDNTHPTAAIFPSMEAGRAAQIALLRTPRYQNRSVGRALDLWSTGEDVPNTDYRNCVRGQTGISMDREMSSLSEQELATLTRGMQHCEGFREGTISALECP